MVKLNIVHVVYSAVANEYYGGISKIVVELAKAQANLGHTVSIYTTKFNGPRTVSYPLEKETAEENINILYFNAKKRFGVYFSESLKKYLKKSIDKYDVVHSHNIFHPLNYYVFQICRLNNKKAFYHTHGTLDSVVLNSSLLKALKKRLYIKLVEKRILSQATGIFANTEHEKRQIAALDIRSNVYILPNGVDIPNGLPVREIGNKTNLRKIVYVGRLHPKKGIHLLVEAFKQVQTQMNDVALLLGGSRDQFPEYVRQIDEYIKQNKIENITWLGFLNESEKYEVLSSATIFSHVSSSEGMAMSILEAMSLGIPTIVGNCYMDDAVRLHCVLESSFNSQSLASKLHQLLSNDDKRRELGKNAKEYICKKHSWNSIAELSIHHYTNSHELQNT